MKSHKLALFQIWKEVNLDGYPIFAVRLIDLGATSMQPNKYNKRR